ncbi:autophagy-related protein 33 [Monosporozyma unispora]|nr:Autophagy- protein 33 [Kazachstania unispora]
MSLCLGIIKGVAVSSLGLYAGILSASTVLSFSKSTSIILSNLDVISKAQLTNLINKIFQIGNVIGTISTTFFGLSYFGAPKIWKHPYLIYGMLTAPLSTLYLFYVKRSTENKLRLQRDSTTSNQQPINISDEENNDTTNYHSVDESVVDLGKKTPPQSQSSSNNDVTNTLVLQNTKSFCNSIGRKLFFATVVSLAGLTQSVIGVYGEGNFA